MTREGFATLVWLMPDQASQTHLRSLIADLARRYDAPLFEPHLTLGKVADQACKEIGVETGPITLEAIGIFTSQDFTKTLFFRFAPTPALQTLRSSLDMNPGGYDPHLSLLYCKLPPGEGKRLAASIGLVLDRITFDRFCVIRCPDPTTTREEVEAWERLGSGALPGA
jgi:2'-5' RNA ligase